MYSLGSTQAQRKQWLEDGVFKQFDGVCKYTGLEDQGVNFMDFVKEPKKYEVSPSHRPIPLCRGLCPTSACIIPHVVDNMIPYIPSPFRVMSAGAAGLRRQGGHGQLP